MATCIMIVYTVMSKTIAYNLINPHAMQTISIYKQNNRLIKWLQDNIIAI